MEFWKGRMVVIIGFVLMFLVASLDSQRIRPWKRHSGKRIIRPGWYRTSEHKTVRKVGDILTNPKNFDISRKCL
jgi:hypothetical protein